MTPPECEMTPPEFPRKQEWHLSNWKHQWNESTHRTQIYVKNEIEVSVASEKKKRDFQEH